MDSFPNLVWKSTTFLSSFNLGGLCHDASSATYTVLLSQCQLGLFRPSQSFCPFFFISMYSKIPAQSSTEAGNSGPQLGAECLRTTSMFFHHSICNQRNPWVKNAGRHNEVDVGCVSILPYNQEILTLSQKPSQRFHRSFSLRSVHLIYCMLALCLLPLFLIKARHLCPNRFVFQLLQYSGYSPVQVSLDQRMCETKKCL